MTETILEEQMRLPVSPDTPAFERLLDTIARDSAERDRERLHPYAAIDLIRAARLGAIRASRHDGGLGVTNRTLFDVVIRLGEADSNVAHALRNHFALVERFIAIEARSPAQSFWLREVAAGLIFGLASGEDGTRQVGNFVENTTLRADGGGFRLDGIKYYSTGTLYADYVQVRAKLPDAMLASVILPAGRPGIERVDDWDGFGQRVTGSGTTIFKAVRVEADEVIPDREGAAQRVPYSNTVSQLILTAINAGILRAIQRDAAALARERERNFYYANAARPGDDPVLQQTVGVIASNAFVAGAAVLAAADALDALDAARRRRFGVDSAAHDAALQAAQAKVVVDELAIRSASLLFEVGGASATRRGPDLDRHWRNARTLASHNPGPLKAQAIGRHAIHAIPLPADGFF